MVRWRAAREISRLLTNPATQQAATEMLLNCLETSKTESEVCALLSIVFLTEPDSRPTRRAVVLRIERPSLLADMLLERIYGEGKGIAGWRWAHSGTAPEDFEDGAYFEEHSTMHVAPILGDNLERLQRSSGLPFRRQWAFEWKNLRDRLGTRFTEYPHYFDDVLEARSGIMGQYWQRMRDVYLSAYLRTLAHAVSEWGLPQKVAEDNCLEIVDGVAGLFEIEPGKRPAWLSEFPERLCAQDADLAAIARELFEASRRGRWVAVSIHAPIAASAQKYARFQLTAHLVTADYQFPPGEFLYERMPFLMIKDTFKLSGPPSKLTIEEASSPGLNGGGQAAVCISLFPIPFGCWQGDYLSLGLPIPAPYVVDGTRVSCTAEGIDLKSGDGELIASTRVWNDGWTPPHPKEGSTRCGVATMMDVSVLEEARERLGRRLGLFVRLQVWTREKDYGEYVESQRSAFILI
jgi:hypothetical protein